jgi:hypothetical protein
VQSKDKNSHNHVQRLHHVHLPKSFLSQAVHSLDDHYWSLREVCKFLSWWTVLIIVKLYVPYLTTSVDDVVIFCGWISVSGA